MFLLLLIPLPPSPNVVERYEPIFLRSRQSTNYAFFFQIRLPLCDQCLSTAPHLPVLLTSPRPDLSFASSICSELVFRKVFCLFPTTLFFLARSIVLSVRFPGRIYVVLSFFLPCIIFSFFDRLLVRLPLLFFRAFTAVSDFGSGSPVGLFCAENLPWDLFF